MVAFTIFWTILVLFSIPDVPYPTQALVLGIGWFLCWVGLKLQKIMPR